MTDPAMARSGGHSAAVSLAEAEDLEDFCLPMEVDRTFFHMTLSDRRIKSRMQRPRGEIRRQGWCRTGGQAGPDRRLNNKPFNQDFWKRRGRNSSFLFLGLRAGG